MKQKFRVTITYEREFDSDWYCDKNPDNLFQNVIDESKSDYFIDTILDDINNLEHEIKIDMIL